MPEKKHIVIVGGGASGFFCAIRCAELANEQNLPVKITILEASSKFLSKVRISGGGRCNVTHHQFDIKNFCENYPRGQKELRSPFHQFQAQDTVEWFEKRGVKIKVEEDGRMFPQSNSSQTIINCFYKLCEKYKIKLLAKHKVSSVKVLEEKKMSLRGEGFEQDFIADQLVIATGGLASGHKLARQLGHSITDLAPSLFTFKINDPLIADLSGISFSRTSLKLRVAQKDFRQIGALLITHWGLSGPALLKLSAWAAREMKTDSYQADIDVNWLGLCRQNEQDDFIYKWKKSNSKSIIRNSCPRELAKRFWEKLIISTNISFDKRISDLSKEDLERLKAKLFHTNLKIIGKNRFKEEFVECGGVNLKEVNFKSMQSKITPHTYFCGEVLDIDGVTGGFNFQNAWTSGWIAGTTIIESIKPF